MITFGSLLAAGLPLLTALIGVGIGMGGLLTVSGFTELNTNTPVLALMIGLAVGIDYALFIVSRYRNELARGLDHEQAVGRAVGTAGSAVVFAGLTVIVALAGLTVVGIPFLGEMGVAAALTVVIAVLIAVTLLPAVLGFAGDKIHGRLPGMRGGPKPGRASMGERWARFVGRHRVAVLGTAIAGGRGRRDPGRQHAARPAQRRHRGAGEHAAQGLRARQRGLRPGCERPADRRRRHLRQQ